MEQMKNSTSQQVSGIACFFLHKSKDRNDRIGKSYRFKTSPGHFLMNNQLPRSAVCVGSFGSVRLHLFHQFPPPPNYWRHSAAAAAFQGGGRGLVLVGSKLLETPTVRNFCWGWNKTSRLGNFVQRTRSDFLLIKIPSEFCVTKSPNREVLFQPPLALIV